MERERMMQKVKVLIIVGSLGIGGNEIFVMNILRSIDYKKFLIDLLIFDGKRLDFYNEVIGYGCKVYICDKTNSTIERMFWVLKFIKNNNQYDTVHVNSCSFKGLLCGTIPAKIVGIKKVIAHSHNSGEPKGNVLDKTLRIFLKILLEYSISLGLSCSDLAGESKYRKKFIASNRYHIVHNAIEVEKYEYNSVFREKIRKHYNIEDRIVIGNVGRLAHQKNQEFLIKIMPYLLCKNDKYFLLIIGGGELEEKLKKLALELEIENNVLFTGSINNVNQYYSAMDVFAMPSLFEGFPFTVIEAQVNGLKCVLSDDITHMANISGDVIFLPLNNEKKWYETLTLYSQSRSDKEKTKSVIDSYDLNQNIKLIEEYYQ